MDKKIEPKKVFKYNCDRCVLRFNQLKNLNYHKRQIHNMVTYAKPSQFPGAEKNCPLCDYCNTKGNLLNHLTTFHNIKLEIENFEFKSHEEFVNWKKSIENETTCMYLKYGHSRPIANFKFYKYYVCHRSGNYVSESKGLRRLKMQGSKKINAFCPSEMKLYYNKRNGNVRVEFMKVHVGHQNEKEYLFSNSKHKNNYKCTLPCHSEQITENEPGHCNNMVKKIVPSTVIMKKTCIKENFQRILCQLSTVEECEEFNRVMLSAELSLSAKRKELRKRKAQENLRKILFAQKNENSKETIVKPNNKEFQSITVSFLLKQ